MYMGIIIRSVLNLDSRNSGVELISRGVTYIERLSMLYMITRCRRGVDQW